MSRKVIIALIIFVVVVGGAFLSTRVKFNSTKVENQIVAEDQRDARLFIDTDGDGLKDWEEDLWKTDPKVSDTDLDKTTDFEEIRQGRDPLVRGPKDLLSTTTVATKINQTLDSDLTETSKLSRELFAKYVAAFQKGEIPVTTDPLTGDRIAESVKVEDYDQLLTEAVVKSTDEDTTLYTIGDFSTSPNSVEAIRVYGNTLGKIIIDAQKKYPVQESALLDSIADGDEIRKEDFDIASHRYGAIKEAMLKMSVPNGVLETHTKIVNLLGILELSVQKMKYITSDPVKAIGWLSFYPDALKFLVLSIDDVRNYFAINKVTFSKNEAGYLFAGTN